MPWMRALLWVGVAVSLASCGSLFRDRANDYRTAQDLPPLLIPPGQDTRPIAPLYAIPPGNGVQPVWPKKSEAPRPKPLPATAAVPAAPAATPDAAPAKPVLGQDGNGYPVLNIGGDFNAIWDRLDDALHAAGVKVDDRDQRVGLYYLNLTDSDGKKGAYQLRVTRDQSAYMLALQKDDDTLAPQAMTKTLFESIVSHWPAADFGDPNGKARPSLHR